jgi:hypothetical protein
LDGVGGRRIVAEGQGSHVVDGLDEVSNAGSHMTQRALDLGMAGMTQQHDLSALPLVPLNLPMDFRNQRAHRVEDL